MLHTLFMLFVFLLMSKKYNIKKEIQIINNLKKYIRKNVATLFWIQILLIAI